MLLKNVQWMPKPNLCEFIKTAPSNIDLVTSCFVFAFHEGKLLIIKHISRGLEVPGGHRENGESLEETAHRELAEEGGVTLKNLRPVGHLKLSVLAPMPENYKYPYPESAQAFFTAEVDKINEFAANLDSIDRVFMPIEEALNLEWIKRNFAIFESVLSLRGLGSSKD